MFSLNLNHTGRFSTSFDYYVEVTGVGVFRPIFISADHLILIATSNGSPYSYYIYHGKKEVMIAGLQDNTVSVSSIQYHDNEFISDNFPELFLSEYALLTDHPFSSKDAPIGTDYYNLMLAIDDGAFDEPVNVSEAILKNNEDLIPTAFTDKLYSYFKDTMDWFGIDKKFFVKILRKVIVYFLLLQTAKDKTPKTPGTGSSKENSPLTLITKFMIKPVLVAFFDNILEWIADNATDRMGVKDELKKRK